MTEKQKGKLRELKRAYVECSKKARLLGKKQRGGLPVSFDNKVLSEIYKYKANVLWNKICELTGLFGMRL